VNLYPDFAQRSVRSPVVSRVVKIVVVAAVLAFVAMQAVPYGHDHANPQVTKDAPWPSQQAAAIARASCYDCHSNQTKWRWYTHIAPASFYTVHDVKEARAALNFSEWDQPQRAAHDLEDVIRGGSMPPREYTILHRGTSLSAADKKTLLDAIASMDPPPGGGGGEGGRGGDGDADSG
jgi:hypothetical protein